MQGKLTQLDSQTQKKPFSFPRGKVSKKKSKKNKKKFKDCKKEKRK